VKSFCNNYEILRNRNCINLHFKTFCNVNMQYESLKLRYLVACMGRLDMGSGICELLI